MDAENATHVARLIAVLRENRASLPDAVVSALCAVEGCGACSQSAVGMTSWSPAETLMVLASHLHDAGQPALFLELPGAVMAVGVSDDAVAAIKSMFVEDEPEMSN